MRNPTYEGKFQHDPMPERCTAMRFITVGEPFDATAEPPSVILAMGVKTMTHNRDGLKLYPTKRVVIEINERDEVASFPLSVRHARLYARRLLEYADAIGDEPVKAL